MEFGEFLLLRETEILGDSIAQCHFVRHNSHSELLSGRRQTAWAMARSTFPSSMPKPKE